HFGWQDGRVDVDKKTLGKLNEFDRTPAAAAPVSFRHENPVDFRNPVNPTDPLDGFEADAKPSPWLLVPQRGGNRLRLVNGGSFSLLTNNHRIAVVERVFSSVGGTFMGLIEVRGVGVGETAILVLDGVRNAVARLEVSVRERRRVTVALHFVKDPDWGT